MQALEQLTAERGAPEETVLDNGSELADKAVNQWFYERGVWLRFIEPGKPVQNAFVRSFHGRLRDECLDPHWVLGPADARHITKTWREDYNRARPPVRLSIGCRRSFDGPSKRPPSFGRSWSDSHNTRTTNRGQIRPMTVVAQSP